MDQIKSGKRIVDGRDKKWKGRKIGFNMQKLLFFQWASFMNRGIEKALQKLDIGYEVFFYQFNDWERDDRFCELFEKTLNSGGFEKVLSVNFAPLVSNLCERAGIPYISWVYDSPVHIRDIEPMKNSCNTIYFFDRGQALAYQSKGIRALYLPLAVDTDLWGQAVRTGKRIPQMEISMVGSLYQTEYSSVTAPLDGYLKGYLEGLVNGQLKVYGGYLIPDLVTDKLLGRIHAAYRDACGGFRINREELEFLLASEVTRRERYIALALLSSYFSVSVYTDQKDENLRNVRFCGYADYETEMPKIFAASKINLNCSLKTIRSGIPLRILDIAGCGGFVLSNYQIELAEYFEIGKECEVYQDLEDLLLKTEFYLKHASLRSQIAQAGLERVKRDFTFAERIRVLLHRGG